MTTVRRRLVVRGRVQGVGYRWSCRDRARQLGLVGWVRNRADGSVELEAEGDAGSVDHLVAWCRRGPDPARVGSVEVADIAPTGGVDFVIRR